MNTCWTVSPDETPEDVVNGLILIDQQKIGNMYVFNTFHVFC